MINQSDQLKDYFRSYKTLNKNDIMETFEIAKLLIKNPKQAFQIQQWNYEIKSDYNLSFMILVVLLQSCPLIFAGNLRQIIVAEIIYFFWQAFWIYGIIIIILRLPKNVEEFKITYMIQSLLYAQFLFIIYNNFIVLPFFIISISERYILNILHGIACYQFYFNFFKLISGLNILKQPEYLLMPLLMHVTFILGLCILQICYYDILYFILNI
ncbi:hypothetical protein pb186bvf_008480 [Paramecium bursaria]